MRSIYQRGKRNGDPSGPYWIAYIGVDGKQYCESARNRSAGIKGNHSDAVRLLNQREGKVADGIATTPQSAA